MCVFLPDAFHARNVVWLVSYKSFVVRYLNAGQFIALTQVPASWAICSQVSFARGFTATTCQCVTIELEFVACTNRSITLWTEKTHSILYQHLGWINSKLFDDGIFIKLGRARRSRLAQAFQKWEKQWHEVWRWKRCIRPKSACDLIFYNVFTNHFDAQSIMSIPFKHCILIRLA